MVMWKASRSSRYVGTEDGADTTMALKRPRIQEMAFSPSQDDTDDVVTRGSPETVRRTEMRDGPEPVGATDAHKLRMYGLKCGIYSLMHRPKVMEPQLAGSMSLSQDSLLTRDVVVLTHAFDRLRHPFTHLV